MELRVGNKYRLGRKIGSGSFGDIYLGKLSFSLSLARTLPLPSPLLPLVILFSPRSLSAVVRQRHARASFPRQARHSIPPSSLPPPLSISLPSLHPFSIPIPVSYGRTYTVDFVYSAQKSLKSRANSYVIPTFLSPSPLIPLFPSPPLVFFVFLFTLFTCMYVYVCAHVKRALFSISIPLLHRYQYFYRRGSRHQVRMYKNATSTIAHRVQVLQDDARRR